LCRFVGASVEGGVILQEPWEFSLRLSIVMSCSCEVCAAATVFIHSPLSVVDVFPPNADVCYETPFMKNSWDCEVVPCI
jgi:hypothetical protein